MVVIVYQNGFDLETNGRERRKKSENSAGSKNIPKGQYFQQ